MPLPRITHHVASTYRCDALTGHPRTIRQVTAQLYQQGHRAAVLVEDGEEQLISIDMFGWMAQPWCPIQPNHPAYAGRGVAGPAAAVALPA